VSEYKVPIIVVLLDKKIKGQPAIQNNDPVFHLCLLRLLHAARVADDHRWPVLHVAGGSRHGRVSCFSVAAGVLPQDPLTFLAHHLPTIQTASTSLHPFAIPPATRRWGLDAILCSDASVDGRRANEESEADAVPVLVGRGWPFY